MERWSATLAKSSRLATLGAVQKTFYLFALAFALSACATADPHCDREIDACLKRCEASGGNEVQHEHVSPEQSMTYCQERCQNCRGSTTPPVPARSSSPPTYTGNATP
jgi:hypothetical protein